MTQVLKNNGTFFNELNKNVKAEYEAKQQRPMSLSNTRQNEPEFQQAETKSRCYVRAGQEIYADPFAFHMQPLDQEYNARYHKDILSTLKYNATKNYPDVITKHPLKVVGRY